jgi:hypothetical protein
VTKKDGQKWARAQLPLERFFIELSASSTTLAVGGTTTLTATTGTNVGPTRWSSTTNSGLRLSLTGPEVVIDANGPGSFSASASPPLSTISASSNVLLTRGFTG